VDAKAFVFSVKEGEAVVRLEERRRGFAGFVVFGVQCTGWLVAMVDMVLRYLDVKDFIKCFREGLKVFIVWRGGNRAKRFLELGVFAKDGRKGLIMIPEGHEGGNGAVLLVNWSKALGFLETKVVTSSDVPYSMGKNSGMKLGPGVDMGLLSYAAVLRAETRFSETVETMAVPSGELLGKDRHSVADPLGNICDAHPFARGNVECASDVAEGGVEFQQGKEATAQGKKTCLFDANDEGEGRSVGKGQLKTLPWAWKGQLLKVKDEVERALRFILEGLEGMG